LDIRWFIFEFGINHPFVQFLNSGLLFISYFIFRIIYHTYISFLVAWPWSYTLFIEQSTVDIEKLPRAFPLFYRSLGLFCWFCNTLSQIVNAYWFSLIVKQVYRNYLKAMGYIEDAGNIQKGMNEKDKAPAGDIELK